MTKIMLVEDDKSLREIYGVRLLAEGYDIVSAGDGEEALAMAIKERPGLIISDVMMPKISGFDMLDILRSTTETKSIKVIMMTALSSDEQRTRGEQLGADRYLVKSQVGIEDVVRVVHEVLGDSPGGAPALTAAPRPAASPSPAPTPQPAAAAPLRPTTAPSAPPRPAVSSMPQPTQLLTSTPPAATRPTAPVTPATPAPPTTPAPATPPSAQLHSSSAPSAPSSHSRVIQPLNDPSTSRVDINELLDKELAKEAGVNPGTTSPQAATTAQEKQMLNDQLSQFTPPATPQSPASKPDLPDITVSPNGQLESDQTVEPKPPMPPVTPAQPAA